MRKNRRGGAETARGCQACDLPTRLISPELQALPHRGSEEPLAIQRRAGRLRNYREK
jgi:hypothetical protein